MIAVNSIVGGRYRVVRRIGGGGMKQVYLAGDTRLADRSCALAEMIDSLADPAERQVAAASFQREADLLAGLEHENIVRIYDRLSEGSRHYLVMEYVEGQTLEQKLESASDKKLDEKTVIEAALQVLGALEYLHGQNPPVVYRDLKPANVMVRANGRIKLIDFGIARLFIPKKTATMVGTQGYAPPEQYEGKAEPRSDLYALGVTMFHLLTGWDPALHPPFMFPQIQSLRPDLNPELAALIGEAMALEASRRIASAAEFRRRLENLASAPEHPSLRMRSVVVQPPMGPDAPTVKDLAAFVCPSCAKPVPADAKFCPYCSADLISAPAPPKPPYGRRRSVWLAGSLAALLAVGFAATYYHFQTQREAVHRLYRQYWQCKDEPCKSALLDSAAPDLVQRTAASGDLEAQFLVGFIYYRGIGVPKNYGEALRWYRKAAEQGNAYAEADLGFAYENGEGVQKDYGEALRWYRKAAEQGNAYGEAGLGEMYDNGKGVPQDKREALNWFQKAAAQGNAEAEGNIGVVYENGEVVPQDYGEALRWYRKAAEQGSADAEADLGEMYYNGKGVPKDYGEALKWSRKAAEQGNADAEADLGDMYYHGEGVPQDYDEAIRWLNKAAADGSENAKRVLEKLYDER
ncbi:MAG: protein kinase domain-containing protein [Beijerinckiaceae bacterium]